MQRRAFIAAPLLVGLPAWAHHGWSSFDQARPLYLEGKVAEVAWANPHVELQLDLPVEGLKLPADLATRSLPASSPAIRDGLPGPSGKRQSAVVPPVSTTAITSFPSGAQASS